MSLCTIYTAGNDPLVVTNVGTGGASLSTLSGPPLGTVGDSATGEIGAKVIVIGGTVTATGGLTDAELRATPVPVSLPSGTYTAFAKTAGQTETIPVGAFNIGVIFLTGTGTIGGVDHPVGIPWNCEARLAATVAVVCGSPGTARVSYLV